MDIPEILYHYTGANGLYGILNTKQIWATSYRYMSDAREFEYGFDLISELYPPEEDKVRGLLSDTPSVEYIKDSIYAGLIKRWKIYYKSDCIFVASFSSKGDSLGQWRGYAGLHSGYSLGFNFKEIESINPDTRLVACCYDKSKQLDGIKRIIDEYLPQMKSAEREGPHELLAKAYWAASDIALLAATLKHPAFEEEEEWRLVVGPLEANNERICYRPGKRLIIPYVNIGFGPSELPLKRIIVGPGPHQERNAASLRQMLILHRFKDVEVSISDAPFRTW